jgi:pimeloyl-ACP methyl ester carboxylesterase
MIKGSGVTVIGNCSGAIFGLLAASHVAGRIDRFVLIDPFAYMPWYFKLFVRTQFGRKAYDATFANPIGRKLTNLSLKRRRASRTDLTATFGSVNHEATYRYLSMLGSLDSVEQFRWLRIPIDIAYGEKTFAAVKRSAALWQQVWPHARRLELAGAGHLPIVEATRQLGEMIFSAPAGAFKHGVSG